MYDSRNKKKWLVSPVTIPGKKNAFKVEKNNAFSETLKSFRQKSYKSQLVAKNKVKVPIHPKFAENT